MNAKDSITYKPVWTIRRYADDTAFAEDCPYDVSRVEGNLLLNEGIAELLALLTGAAADHFGNANARLAVGADDTAAAAGQTGLQAETDKLYKAVEATYPQISGQTITWRAIFGSDDANFNWREFTVANGSSDAADNLNRLVSSQGTKASGQTWTLDLEITFS